MSPCHAFDRLFAAFVVQEKKVHQVFAAKKTKRSLAGKLPRKEVTTN